MAVGALSILVTGVVQGVGFRPFIYRLAQRQDLTGWVRNGAGGVEIFAEGARAALSTFVRELQLYPPIASTVTNVNVIEAAPAGLTDFSIRESMAAAQPTAQVSPDLPVCDACLAEMFDPTSRRYRYPYINCTNCGPRYSVTVALPYDRSNTTMREWLLDDGCSREYQDPADRRFHAEPIACPSCGPSYSLRAGAMWVESGAESIDEAARRLRTGEIVAIKGIGGYHLACDARNVHAVLALRTRKVRREKPFAVMVRDLTAARSLATLTPGAEHLLQSPARPIVLVSALTPPLAAVAPETDEIGLMLPYAPLHYLLFADGAPPAIVLTSANRSSEPIAYQDEEAFANLAGVADSFLVGGRPIARRVEDSVVRHGACGPVILRRSRGLAPGVVARLPGRTPILAVGADLKNTVTLVVDGQAIVSQHIGDLDYHEARAAFHQTVDDLLAMYGVKRPETRVAHDTHPEYVTTLDAKDRPALDRWPVQHHRAHIASVVAEREAWDRRVIGLSFDGTGYGDDGTIWGGEFFAGSVEEGFARVAHLRPARLAGGDAAARHPARAAAGFLADADDLPDLGGTLFGFGPEYDGARRLIEATIRVTHTTSMGRLFDAVAALVGFTRRITYEGQAAMWLECLARRAVPQPPYPMPIDGSELDYRPLLEAIIQDRIAGRDRTEIARAFHSALARAATTKAAELCDIYDTNVVVCSGGAFQNDLLLSELAERCAAAGLEIWINHAVPPNDGGISLGQAAIAAFA